MMTFGDRTTEFAAIAQALRNKGMKPAVRRKENIYTMRMNLNRLANEIGKDTHATAQKLAVLTRCTSATGHTTLVDAPILSNNISMEHVQLSTCDISFPPFHYALLSNRYGDSCLTSLHSSVWRMDSGPE